MRPADPDVLRTRLAVLVDELEALHHRLNDSKQARLLEANEQLTLATLQAQAAQKAAVDELSAMTISSQRDALTDLPNRAVLLDRLHRAISLAERRNTQLAVLFIDVDRFKDINDTYGHAIGDEALQLVARRLEAVVRHSDTVSRHSGDEFVVLLSEISQRSDAAQIVQKMLDSVAAPPTASAHLAMSASIGIAIYPDDAEDASSLIAHADAAMYRSKKMGDGGFQFFGDMVDQDAMDATSGPGTRPIPLGDGMIGTLGPTPQADRVHDLREANEQLVLSLLAQRETQELARQVHLRQINFLAMVSHELRNPLTPIQVAVELMHRVRDDEQQHARLQKMLERQMAHLVRIVDDLLDGSRVHTGKFHLHHAEVDLAAILELAAQSCQPAMEAKRQHFTLRIAQELPPVSGDAVRLGQVFRNLLENASKYSPQGGDISLSSIVSEGHVVTTISDNGIGISAEALPHVFDLYTQDAKALAVNQHGLGIGLAVVRELVEGHQGTVLARSAGQDLGSEFVVTLPVLAAIAL